MSNEIIVRDVDTAIQQEIDPVLMATVYYPEMEKAIELASTPGEANEIRGKIDTVQTYIKSKLPKFVKERVDQFKITHKGDTLYVEASGKAGALWSKDPRRRPIGWNQYEGSGDHPTLSAKDVGFKGSRDGTTCERIGDLHEEDRRTYYEECDQNMKQSTNNGAERVWLAYFQADPPAPIDGKYRVFYADPPWKYGNMRFGGTTMPDDHYPVMTIGEICTVPVKQAAEDNAILFLWVPSPILFESEAVIEAWGFEYKTSFVWDKVKHNMGHYNSVRHEFLLVCVRGSCQPDVIQLFDSVVTEERGKHSEKPEVFREIIDTLYPDGNRIELFARESISGWDAYGNEVIPGQPGPELVRGRV